MNEAGEVIERGTVLNNQVELVRFSKANRGAMTIMEAGCHSPWISRLLEGRGHKVIIANPRKVRAIYETDNKNDERDAELLARIGRFDRNLLYGIEHKSEEHQRALKVLNARDALVAARVKLINHVRGSLKSLGIFLPSGCSTEALKLMKIPGVGPITSLAFVLIVGSPDRFETARDVGPFLGLVPGRDQSGESDKPMRITKSGDRMLRRLLVSCAQYTLGAFGPPSALKEAGERRAKKGTKIAKKKAVVMTARKTAVTMLALWKDPGSQYTPFPQQPKREKIAA